jgi:hypothetical protein
MKECIISALISTKQHISGISIKVHVVGDPGKHKRAHLGLKSINSRLLISIKEIISGLKA